MFDTLKARKFYDTTKMDLTKPRMYDITEIYFLSETRANDIHEEIKNGKISFDSAAELYTQRTGFREKKGKHGIVYAPNKFADSAASFKLKAGEYSAPYSNTPGYSIIKVNSIDPERRLTFEESIQRISSHVQAQVTRELEQN